MAVNLRAPFLLSQALAPAMIAQRWGKIVNISSQTGVIALDDHAAYASSKGGLNALTKSLAPNGRATTCRSTRSVPTVVLTPMGIEVWWPARKGRPVDRGARRCAASASRSRSPMPHSTSPRLRPNWSTARS